MIHNLKILSEHFWPVVSDEKKAEVRLNDRNYHVGDFLRLQEWNPETGYTDKIVVRIVTHVADLSQWKDGYVLLSIRKLS